MKKHFQVFTFSIVFAAVATAIWAQSIGQPVSIVQYPNETPTIFMDYNGGTNLTYLCVASPLNKTSTQSNYAYSLSVAAGTLTSIVVSTNTGTVTTVNAHGLMVGQTTTVSGSTTTALNGSYVVQTVPSTTTFTITTAGVGNATYNNGPLTVAGSVPLLTSPIWSIRHFTYDGNNNLTGTQCANGACNLQTNICANRASLSYQ